MSHAVEQKSHTKLHQHLLSGNTINVQGYSHTVCVRNDSVESWIEKGYEIIQDGGDSVLLGKKAKKAVKQEEVKQEEVKQEEVKQ